MKLAALQDMRGVWIQYGWQRAKFSQFNHSPISNKKNICLNELQNELGEEKTNLILLLDLIQSIK